MSSRNSNYDYLLVGGGLQSSLTALAIRHYQPDATVAIVERNSGICGNHTWSFHESDVPSGTEWLDSVKIKKWPSYQVRFPGFERRVDTPYCSIKSEDLATAVAKEQGLKFEILTDLEIERIEKTSVLSSCGWQATARCIIDCRGRQGRVFDKTGYQKFLGLEVRLQHPWPDQTPILMEANVDQSEGFRFLYVLPFASNEVLIEDTSFSDDSKLDEESSRQRIVDYLSKRVEGRWEIVREEKGCLPMPYGPARQQSAEPEFLMGGFAGGWFHAATGYSFPLAVRFANVIATSTPQTAKGRLASLQAEHRFQGKYSRFLNRLLFRLVRPERRFEIFRRFYRSLPDRTIKRFYAHTFTVFDAARILIGRPPGGLTPIRFLQSLRS